MIAKPKFRRLAGCCRVWNRRSKDVSGEMSGVTPFKT